jgi:hypothetical protein
MSGMRVSSSDASAPVDAGIDAATPDATTDGPPAEAGADAGTDGAVDAGLDAGVDSGADAGRDAGEDSGRDAGADAAGAADAGEDSGPTIVVLDAASPSGGDASFTPFPAASGGCGCRLSGVDAHGAGASWLAAPLLALALLVRRRRQGDRTASEERGRR